MGDDYLHCKRILCLYHSLPESLPSAPALDTNPLYLALGPLQSVFFRTPTSQMPSILYSNYSPLLILFFRNTTNIFAFVHAAFYVLSPFVCSKKNTPPHPLNTAWCVCVCVCACSKEFSFVQREGLKASASQRQPLGPCKRHMWQEHLCLPGAFRSGHIV